MNEQLPPLPHLPASQPYVWVWIGGEKRFESANSIYFTADQMRDYARAALAAKVPAGYKLVPIEPTEGILRALTDPFIAINGDNRKAFAKAWAAMLAATPAPAPEAEPAQAHCQSCGEVATHEVGADRVDVFAGYYCNACDPMTAEPVKAAPAQEAAKVPADPHMLAKALRTGLRALICAGSNDECQSLEVYAKQVMREALAAYDAAAPAPEAESLQEQLDEALSSLDFYKRRSAALQACQHMMRDPERTMVCDILANGSLLINGKGELAPERYAPAQAQQSHRYILELPNDDKRTARVVWSDRKEEAGKITHSLCVAVGEAKPEAQQAGEPLTNIESPFNACQHREHCKGWKMVATDVVGRAKPEAQQPLPNGEINDAALSRSGRAEFVAGFYSGARFAEAACAEAWGVKLAGIGASGEASK